MAVKILINNNAGGFADNYEDVQDVGANFQNRHTMNSTNYISRGEREKGLSVYQ